ncbi:MAG: isoaspartyl peptidase/L-asparaginase family protein [Candidatus Dormibacteraeota bacterium]|nr:isoaspartyl peptidase/L-asparaginase family protein [Candidatus Dormibacteraeota bacterium]
MPTLMVHGGAADPPEAERSERQAAVERALGAGWAAIGGGALEAVLAAVRLMEDEPCLNAGVGAVPNLDGEFELDAGLMLGTGLRVGAVGAVRDVRHPIDLARAVLEDGRHVLLVADGASRFASEHGLQPARQADFATPNAFRERGLEMDTVGAVARDDQGGLAVAVSTGGMRGKLPGRLGDTPVPGAGFFADDRFGAACGTGQGEGFLRLSLSHLAVLMLTKGTPAAAAAQRAVDELRTHTGATGGILLIDAEGRPAAAHNTPFMAWAQRLG